VIRHTDVEAVKSRFGELITWSLLGHKIAIDNSGSLDDTMADFKRNIEPHLTDTDRTRILAHSALS